MESSATSTTRWVEVNYNQSISSVLQGINKLLSRMDLHHVGMKGLLPPFHSSAYTDRCLGLKPDMNYYVLKAKRIMQYGNTKIYKCQKPKAKIEKGKKENFTYMNREIAWRFDLPILKTLLIWDNNGFAQEITTQHRKSSWIWILILWRIEGGTKLIIPFGFGAKCNLIQHRNIETTLWWECHR